MNANGIFTVKAALTGFLAWGAARWGWVGWLVLLWIACFVTDYVTGSLAACKNHDWSSTAAREGLWRKGAMITVVLVALLFDFTLWLAVRAAALELPVSGVILTPVVLIWYTITELGSILENAIKMGAEHVPAWLARGLRDVTGAIDKVGNAAAKGENNGDR